MGESKKPKKKLSIKTMMMKQLLGAVVCLLTLAKPSNAGKLTRAGIEKIHKRITDTKQWIEDHKNDKLSTGFITVGQYASWGLLQKSKLEEMQTHLEGMKQASERDPSNQAFMASKRCEELNSMCGIMDELSRLHQEGIKHARTQTEQ